MQTGYVYVKQNKNVYMQFQSLHRNATVNRQECHCQQAGVPLSTDGNATVNRWECHCQQAGMPLSTGGNATVNRQECHCQQVGVPLSTGGNATVNRRECHFQTLNMPRDSLSSPFQTPWSYNKRRDKVLILMSET